MFKLTVIVVNCWPVSYKCLESNIFALCLRNAYANAQIRGTLACVSSDMYLFNKFQKLMQGMSFDIEPASSDFK